MHHAAHVVHPEDTTVGLVRTDVVGAETVRFDASEVRVSSSAAQSLPVISTTPRPRGVLARGKVSELRQKRRNSSIARAA